MFRRYLFRRRASCTLTTARLPPPAASFAMHDQQQNQYLLLPLSGRRFYCTTSSSSPPPQPSLSMSTHEVAQKLLFLRHVHGKHTDSSKENDSGEKRSDIERIAWYQVQLLSTQDVDEAAGEDVAVVLSCWAYFARWWRHGALGPDVSLGGGWASTPPMPDVNTYLAIDKTVTTGQDVHRVPRSAATKSGGITKNVSRLYHGLRTSTDGRKIENLIHLQPVTDSDRLDRPQHRHLRLPDEVELQIRPVSAEELKALGDFYEKEGFGAALGTVVVDTSVDRLPSMSEYVKNNNKKESGGSNNNNTNTNTSTGSNNNNKGGNRFQRRSSSSVVGATPSS
eukprot:PhM_4_TR3227/c0_g1_i1/m.70756